MKGKGKLLVLIAALAVLAGAWLLAESMAGRLTKKQEEETAEQPETIVLAAGTEDGIQALAWERDGEAVSLRRGETSLWENAEDAACPVDQSAVEPLVRAAANVTASMSIAGVTDFSQYGLDAPGLTLAVDTADHAVTYEVGSETLLGEYYLRVDNTDMVYTIDAELMVVFQCGLDELLAMESGPENIASVEALTVTSAAGDYELLRREDLSDVWYGSAYRWYAARDGEVSPLEEASAALLYEAVTGIEFLQCVDWHSERFAAYGLLSPQAVATVSYTAEEGAQKSFALRFGNYEQGNVYVNIVGSEVVYLASGTVLDGLMYPDWEAMTPLMVCPLDMDAVTGFTVELGGHTYEVERHTETSESVDSDGNMETEQTDYYVANGWTLDSAVAAAWVGELTELTANSLAEESGGMAEMLSVTFHLDSELWPAVTVSLETYDSTRCLCVVNGEKVYFVSRTDAETLVTGAENLLILE